MGTLWILFLAFALSDGQSSHEAIQHNEDKCNSSGNHVNHGRRAWPFAIVADLDRGSRQLNSFRWSSVLKFGVLHENAAGIDISWTESARIESHLSYRNRGMELSALAFFHGSLWTICDSSGVVYEIDARTAFKTGRAIPRPRHVLADPGLDFRPSKNEWMTVVGDELYVGGHGKEWSKGGKIMGRGAEFVKVISGPDGSLLRYVDWAANYQSLRRRTNTTWPGYLSHEAVEWLPESQSWLFLPRKESHGPEPYANLDDETRGTNLALTYAELRTPSGAAVRASLPDPAAEEEVAAVNLAGNGSVVEVRRLGLRHKEWGVTAARTLPGRPDVVVLLRVLEKGDLMQSALDVVSLTTGLSLLTPALFTDQKIGANINADRPEAHTLPHHLLHMVDGSTHTKFEGLAFLPSGPDAPWMSPREAEAPFPSVG